jgi:uncharacterized protein (TIGR02680 family)
MTIPFTAPSADEDVNQTPAKHHPGRWRLHRGGILNVWFYYDARFSFSGGRVIWRGTNGAGKSRAMEMLLPYLLDADRRNIDASLQQKVRLEDLMSAGAGERGANRIGYLWLELVGDDGDGNVEYVTLGALIRYSRSSMEAKAWYFTTPLRVGIDLQLMDDTREPLSRERLGELIGVDRVTDSPETHRERVRTQLFALTGDAGKERFAGLLRLLHVLRDPDVGNRIEAGKLPGIVSDALPPLSETALSSAGQQLDALSETRATQRQLEQAAGHVAAFLDSYRRYAAGVLLEAGEDARATAEDATGAARAEVAARREHDDLTSRHAAARAALVELEGRESALEGTINGIRASKAYADAAELDEVEQRVAALRRTAERAFGGAASARNVEADRAADADGRAEEAAGHAEATARTLHEARQALGAAGMPTDALPADVAARPQPGDGRTETVRTGCDDDPQQVPRPAVATLAVTPADPQQAATSARTVARAAQTRAGQAGNRLTVARELAVRLGKVTHSENAADDAEQRAQDAADRADAAADHRDRAAVTLATTWRDWTGEARTAELLGPVAWAGTAVGPLLTDAELLAGDADDTDSWLTVLDRTADEAAAGARQRLADDRAEVNQRQKQADQTRAQLQSEAADLRAERDPDPQTAPWQTAAPDGGVPLWRAVDFAADVPADVQAAVEGALHAAGMLTAHLTADGTITAANGQVLLTEAGPTARRSVRELLAADPACPLAPATVTAVLDRIALDDRAHPVWIGTDGAWGNGPLTGRNPAAAARHIGAQARAAHRAARLTAIEAELATLRAQDAERDAERKALTAREGALTAHLRTAPRCDALRTARIRAADDAERATAADAAARAARTRAQELRRAWHADSERHLDACRAFALPAGADELADAQRAATSAAAACDRLAGRLTELVGQLARHARAVAAVESAAAARGTAELTADTDWSAWRTATAELTALRESAGADAAAVRAQLRAAEEELRGVKAELKRARAAESTLGQQAAAMAETVKAAVARAAAARDDLADAVDRLHRLTGLRGVADAALADGATLPPLPPADPVTLDPVAVEAAVRALAATVDTRGGPADENAVIRAQQTLERELTGTFDVVASAADGVRLFELVDATGPHTVAAAHAALGRQVEQGRAALSERERRVFTKFILGGVAEELQRRLKQAQDLVEAMNASLGAIRTSHGIGVRVTWALRGDVDSPLTRIRELVTLAGDVRTVEQDAELTELIKDRVDDSRSADPTAGYAEHLQAALDYRKWHEIEVIIRGPAAGQERRISKRSKLSQGETRFVSYVTLFAAVDAYLSGLPDISRALRLIVLDDAFAKVDSRTIGVLMGLLVRLDIDFAMTGHALWGTYPQVPSLDVYEVRRREGSAAITTHVYWDGHTRHLRAAS